MQKLLRNPLFYTSLVLAILLGLQVSGFVSAYTPPTQPPTGGNPAQPLDTSTMPQAKVGKLTQGSISETVMPNITIDGGISGLQSILFNNSNTDIGKIYYSGGKLMAKNSSGNAFEIGKGGDSLWKKLGNTNDIFYNDGAVRINGNDLLLEAVETAPGVSKYYYEFVEVVSSLQTPRLECDKIASQRECPDKYDTNVTASSPSLAYDQFDVGTDTRRPLNKSVKYALRQLGGSTEKGGVIKAREIWGKVVYTTGNAYFAEAPRNGSREVPMIGLGEGICFLTSVAGKFNGRGESAQVIPKGDKWVLLVSAGDISGDQTPQARARCIGIPNTGGATSGGAVGGGGSCVSNDNLALTLVDCPVIPQ